MEYSFGTPGDLITFHLDVKPTSGGTVTVYTDSDNFDDNGKVLRIRSMTTGIAFGPGTAPVFGLGARRSESAIAYAHGYYVDVP